MISVVCPFYNEASILDAAVRSMLENLRSLDEEWELIIVNDGSTDGSLEIAQAFQADEPRLQGLTYPINRGRGYAIRTGAAAARGELIVTTKIDSSWGDDIVHRLVAELHARPDADIVVASPNLPGGRYKNVPIKRVFFSKYGNLIIRAGLRYSVTMNTGMTRGYRAEKFRALPLEEDEKEMHLEVINKALAFGYRIYEIPATLEWKDHRLAAAGQKRKSSTSVNKIVRTHLLFSVGAAPFRFMLPVSILLALAAAGAFGWAVFNLTNPNPSALWLLTSISLAFISFLILGIGMLALQNREIMVELWRARSDHNAMQRRAGNAGSNDA